MKTETKVGTFVIGCAALLGFALYYMNGEQWGRHLTRYKTYFRYAAGIGSGSQVLFGGIQAGRVVSAHSWSVDPTQIEILFELEEGTPVNSQSVATLKSVSMTSSPVLSIATGSSKAPLLHAGDAVPSAEAVSIDDLTRQFSGLADTAQGLLVQVQGELRGVTARADTLLANLNQVTGPANREQLAGILQNMNSLIAEQSPKIDKITSQAALLAEDTDAVIKKAGPLVDDADATISNVNETVDQLREPVRQDLAQLQVTLAQAKDFIASLQGVVVSNKENLRETLDNLRVATENLDQLTDEVKQQPWSLVRIRQPKDRKVPQ